MRSVKWPRPRSIASSVSRSTGALSASIAGRKRPITPACARTWSPPEPRSASAPLSSSVPVLLVHLPEALFERRHQVNHVARRDLRLLFGLDPLALELRI